jgi:hypothetical protein
MDLPLWARKCSEDLVRGSCNHFAVIADKWPCVLDGLAGPSMCVRMCIYICVCVYVYIYILIKVYTDLSLWARICSECLVCSSCNLFAVTADKRPCEVYGLTGLSLCVFVYIYIFIK